MEELQVLRNIANSSARLIKYIAREFSVYDVEGFKCPHVKELAKNLMPEVENLLPKRPQSPSPPGLDPNDPPPYKDGPSKGG